MFAFIRLTLRRARQERMAQVAGSLTFTTVLSLVPLLTVCLAVFTRFPVFSRFERALEEHLLRSLLPADLSRTVLQHLRQFADNANGLTLVGTLFLLGAALALLLTIENALNQIWGVRRGRPLLKRVGLYAVMLAVGPLLLGVALWGMSYLFGASVGLVDALPPEARFALTLGPLALAAVGLSALFRFVPNAPVRWHEAIAGGVLASLALEGGKRLFTAYVLKFPTYKAVYGAFASLPVFLLWLYFSWLVTLVGALIAASLGGAGAKPEATRARRPRR